MLFWWFLDLTNLVSTRVWPVKLNSAFQRVYDSTRSGIEFFHRGTDKFGFFFALKNKTKQKSYFRSCISYLFNSDFVRQYIWLDKYEKKKHHKDGHYFFTKLYHKKTKFQFILTITAREVLSRVISLYPFDVFGVFWYDQVHLLFILCYIHYS